MGLKYRVKITSTLSLGLNNEFNKLVEASRLQKSTLLEEAISDLLKKPEYIKLLDAKSK